MENMMSFVSYHPLFCGILRLLPELKKTSFTLLQNKLWKTTDSHQTPQRQLVSKQALCRVILIKIFKEFSRDSWVICINDTDMAHMQAHPLDPNVISSIFRFQLISQGMQKMSMCGP